MNTHRKCSFVVLAGSLALGSGCEDGQPSATSAGQGGATTPVAEASVEGLAEGSGPGSATLWVAGDERTVHRARISSEVRLGPDLGLRFWRRLDADRLPEAPDGVPESLPSFRDLQVVVHTQGTHYLAEGGTLQVRLDPTSVPFRLSVDVNDTRLAATVVSEDEPQSVLDDAPRSIRIAASLSVDCCSSAPGDIASQGVSADGSPPLFSAVCGVEASSSEFCRWALPELRVRGWR